MHKIIFYVDRKGNSPLLEYTNELKTGKSKDS